MNRRPRITQDRPESATGVQRLWPTAKAPSGFLSGLLSIASGPEGSIGEFGHRPAADSDQSQEKNE